MSIIIRLQNLAWAANSLDIRRYFTGLSIPEGGVHIVGGEKGDAFIAFSTDEDARQAMEKDGGKIKEMKIKLLLSSRTEMLRVIEQARQQNLAVQPADSDRRRGGGSGGGARADRSPSPSPRPRRSSPVRDKRRSSKRDRTRSRSRSPNRRSRDVDRRNSSDRFRRDDRRLDDGSQRYNRENREERPKRDSTRDYDRKNESSTYYEQHPQKNYPYATEPKNVDSPQRSDPVFDNRNSVPKTDPVSLIPFQEKRDDMRPISPSVGYQRVGASQVPQQKEVFDKRPPPHQEVHTEAKPRRKSRFEPEFPSPAEHSFFPDRNLGSGVTQPLATSRVATSENDSNIASAAMYKTTHAHEPPAPFGRMEENNRPWPRKNENGDWEEKRPSLLNRPPIPAVKNMDFVQVVPMDIDDGQNSSPERVIEKEQIYRHPPGNLAPSNRPQHADMPFGRGEVPQMDNMPLRNNHESMMEPRKLQGNAPGNPSLVVQVRGLHANASQSDVLQLFRGIPVPPENITLEMDSKGMSAYVQFLNIRDFQEGLSRSMQFVGQNRFEVSSCPPFNSMNNNNRNVPPVHSIREEDLCIQLRGLPLSCKDDSVVHFFDGLGILDLFVERGVDGRVTGIGYVEFGSINDLHASLAMSGKMMGHHPITIVTTSKEMMTIAQREGLQRQEQFKYEQNVSVYPTQAQRPPMQGSNAPMCIVLRGLPETVMNRDIADYFSEVNVIPRAIHIMLKPNKKPAGDAFAELSSPRDLDAALQQNGKFLLGVRVSVTPITYQEMSEIMGRPPQSVPQEQPHEPSHIPPHMQPHMPQHMQPRGPTPALLQTPAESAPRRPMNVPDEHGVDLPPHHGRALLDRFESPRGPRPFLNMQGPSIRGPRPPNRPNSSDETPRGQFSDDGPPRGSFQADGPPRGQFHPDGPQRGQFDGPPRGQFDGAPRGQFDGAPRGQFRGDGPMRGQFRGDGPRGQFHPDGPPRGQFRGNGPRGQFRGDGPRGQFRGDGPPRGSARFGPRNSGHHISERGPKGFGPNRFSSRNAGPPNSERGPKDFGSPGCVIGINNLHFRAGLEELLEFFEGYSLGKDSIIRKYNENGQTTGEARVAFQNPDDAQRAVRELNQKPIMGRPLSLCIV